MDGNKDDFGAFPLPGMISKAMVAECHTALMDVINHGSELFFRFREEPDDPWDAWCREQPSGQRSYLRALRAGGRAAAFAAYFNARDHTLLLADCFDEPKNTMRIWSYLSLARAACEAFVRVAVISDRTTDPERQLLICAASAIDGSQQQVLLAQDVALEVVPKAEAQLAADLKRCARAGIKPGTHKSRVQRVSRGDITVNTSMNITKETEARIQGVPGPYRIGSAAAHSGAWFLASAMGDNGTFAPRADPDIIVVSALTVIYAHLAAVGSVATAQAASEVATYELRVDSHGRKIIAARHADHPMAE